MSTGTAQSASALSLFVTGFCIVALATLAIVPTFVIAWIVDQFLHWSLPAVVLRVGEPADPVRGVVANIAVNLLGFLIFLVLLRFSPLAAHHAAEHMTVHAIERYGILDWEAHVAEMPRAHMRCGSNLLAGILPSLLIAVPLLEVAPPLAAVVAIVGWVMRQRVGFVIQNTFTTRPPRPHQLARGIDAARRLLAKWSSDPYPALTPAQRFWRRGVPPMVAGVLAAIYTIRPVLEHLHIWLDR